MRRITLEVDPAGTVFGIAERCARKRLRELLVAVMEHNPAYLCSSVAGGPRRTQPCFGRYPACAPRSERSDRTRSPRGGGMGPAIGSRPSLSRPLVLSTALCATS